MEEQKVLAPKAPRDPEKKRKSFYIMRNKQVAGSPQTDGSGTQVIFMNDERLVSFARIAGGVSDEELLKLLRTAEGFRRLVYAMGVSVETEDLREMTGFVMQMYGKTDPCVSGTQFETTIQGDGMEYLIKLSDVVWSEDDDTPGQIRFRFARANTLARVSVRLYLQDGFEAPEPEEEEQVDFSLPEYRKMLDRSLLSMGNCSRLRKVINKARAGEETTVAFIGGSITQGAGAIPINDQCYAWKTFQGFCTLCGRGTEENIHYVKAGVGGTSSELGMVRYDRDVCGEGKIFPDLVVVEFAVNDEGDETGGESFECLVRKILRSPGEPAVILLFSVFSNDVNLQERLSKVGEAYELPMVSLKDCVVEQFYLKPETGRVISKNQYFYDVYHPSNVGHTVMADCMLHLLRAVDEAGGGSPVLEESVPEPEGGSPTPGEGVPEPEEGLSVTDKGAGESLYADHLDNIAPVYGIEFEDIRLIDRSNAEGIAEIDCGDFSETDTDLQAVERDRNLFRTPEFPHNWMHAAGSRPFCMDIVCSALLIVEKDSASPRWGCAEVFVDGKKARVIDPREVGWVHCNALILFRGMERKKHHVEIRMAEGDEEKQFTILGFGYVEEAD